MKERSHPVSGLWLVAVLALVVPLILAGCEPGSPASAYGEPVPAEPGNIVHVTLTDSAIEPDNIHVRLGTITFEVTNEGSRPHNLAVDSNGIHFESPVIMPGESATWQVAIGTPGPHILYSSLPGDREAGLEANLNVGTGGTGA